MKKIFKHEINGESKWIALLSKAERERPAKTFVIKPLSQKDTDAMCKLSQEVYAHLRKDEQTFIHQHDEAYFHAVFNQQKVHYIGVFHQERLVAMSYIKVCPDEKSFLEDIPFNAPSGISADSPVATFGGDCVHPDFRGNGLNQIMVDFRLHQAKKKSCLFSYSIIDRHNHWNMMPYFNNDFCMLSSGIDPSDQGKIAVMRHGAPQQHPKKNDCVVSVPFHHFEQIDTLFKNGFIACSYDTKTQHLAFARMMPQRIRTHGKSIAGNFNRRGENTHD